MSEKGHSNRFISLIKGFLLWSGSLMLWFWYAFNTLDRSEAAYQANNGSGPMLSGYSLAILGILLMVLLSRQFFSKEKNIKSIVVKLLVVSICALGLFTQVTYDPSLSKLMAYKNSPAKEFTGAELFEAVNKHRASIGVQTLTLEETFCGNLVERWMAVKNPDNGHKGFEEWWADKKLTKDPYGQINELYATAGSVERVIQLWTSSPGHKIPLEDPKYNVACTYAGEGTGVMIIGEKPEK